MRRGRQIAELGTAPTPEALAARASHARKVLALLHSKIAADRGYRGALLADRLFQLQVSLHLKLLVLLRQPTPTLLPSPHQTVEPPTVNPKTRPPRFATGQSQRL